MANPNDRLPWNDEDTYWRTNYRTRPYASSTSHEYEYFQPGYRYGYEMANRFPDRSWKDVEGELSKGWSTYEHRGKSTWEQMKDTVRDAWDRVTGKRPVGAR